VGFYSTGPRIRPADTQLDALFRSRSYAMHPVLLIVDVSPSHEGLPVQAYVTHEEVAGGGRDIVRSFAHVPTEITASEAEEVGVEHLLRDINNPAVSHLVSAIEAKRDGVRALAGRLQEISGYLAEVQSGKLPQNNELLEQLQVRPPSPPRAHRIQSAPPPSWLMTLGFIELLRFRRAERPVGDKLPNSLTRTRAAAAALFRSNPPSPFRQRLNPPPPPLPPPPRQTALSLLPNLTVDPLPASMFEVTNDAHLSIYIASLGRSVVALHDLLQNKRQFKDVEREGDKAAEKEKAEGAKEARK
jgi:hypothetical protein